MRFAVGLGGLLVLVVLATGCGGAVGSPSAPTVLPPTSGPLATSAPSATQPPSATNPPTATSPPTATAAEPSGRTPAGDFFLGQAEAPVTLDEYGDFQ